MINRVEEVRATGGVFRSALWRDVVAGILNRPLVVTGAAEGSGLGAAILGTRETMHYEVPKLLQRYGRLGADIR
ncbi:MAG: FGGY-family carbohydrate kinase [Actinomycetota bacterium]